METIVTPEFRVSFPHVFVPKTQNNRSFYSIQMLIPKSANIEPLKQAIKEAANAQWPDPNKRPARIENPIKDGDTDIMSNGTLRKEKYPECAGHWVLSATKSAKGKRPGVVDGNVQPILSEELFYAGCYAIAAIHVYAYYPTKDNPQKKDGIGFGLEHLQKTRDGEPFTGESRVQDVFGVIENTNTQEGSSNDSMFD